ncbi:LAS seventeen-binding protein 3 [Desulforamulus hydrothermalis]|uniref:LAS seventeen-binding protein 3 n=1 Tax=Desulforamulus hydrothermalis TaxID=412895 RepID=UPI00031CD5ED|nr:LAS seventeen-binding protein 3 [Desulforamulus hydrothermalis]SHG89530.1 hypothetical protein SAMN02745177_00745 [Desulforamulus hydrothermalis Lam5 = DSM 18033]
MKRQKPKENFAAGKKFVQEPTGSATKIKVDGQGDYDFYQPANTGNSGSGDNPLAE